MSKMKKAGRYYFTILLTILLATVTLVLYGQHYENWQSIKASYMKIELNGLENLNLEDMQILDSLRNIGENRIDPFCLELYRNLIRKLEIFISKDSDSDGLTDYEENVIYQTELSNPDTDNDGLNDGEEVIQHKTNPIEDDTDGDGLKDGHEVGLGYDPLEIDIDGDMLNDSLEFIYGTNPRDNDTDNDGLNDGEEVMQYETNPLDNDTDGDRLTDYEEIIIHKTSAFHRDTDNDGLLDHAEINIHGTDPLKSDHDNDKLLDGDEINNYKTNPKNEDTDGDGLLDGDEIFVYGTDPLKSDTDGDGYSDYEKVNIKQQASNKESDGPIISEPNFGWTINTGLFAKGISADQKLKDVRRAVAVDNMGSCYFANQFTSQIELATFEIGTKIESKTIKHVLRSNYQGIVVAKFSPIDDNHVYSWSHKIESKKELFPTCITVDNMNNCYLIGTFSSSLKMDGNDILKSNGRINSFLIKFGPHGKYKWAKSLNLKKNNVFCNDIKVGINNNLYIAGGFSGTLMLNESIFVESETRNNSDIFLAKLNSSGKPLWVTKAGGGDIDIANALAVDNDGNIVITGMVRSRDVMFSSATPGGNSGTMATPEFDDIFVAKYDNDGNYLWSCIAGGKDNDSGQDVCIDRQGYIYVAANFSHQIFICGQDGPIAHGNVNIIVIRFDPIGRMNWNRHYSSNGVASVHSIAIDDNNRIYVAGNFTENLATLGSLTINSDGNNNMDGFVHKIDSENNVIWNPIRFGVKHDGDDAIKGGEGATDLAVDRIGKYIYISGYFSGRSKIGFELLSSIGYSNFVSRLKTGRVDD